MLVPAERTPLSPNQARMYLSKALGFEGDAVTILLSQVAFETAAFQSLYNHNFSNITTPGTWPDGYFQLRHRDSSEDIQKYRNYKSFDDGARDLVGLIKTRYPEAYQAMIKSDTPGFVNALKKRGYFTGDKDDYLAGINRYVTQFGGLASPLADRPAAPAHSSSSALLATLPTVRLGMHGVAVAAMQRLLGEKKVDGDFGSATVATLRQYQATHQLLPDGVCGPKTWFSLVFMTQLP